MNLFPRSLTLGLLLVACGDPPPPLPPMVLPPLPPEAVLVAPRAISSPVAFDLVDSAGGALLAWGAPLTEGGGMRVLDLDPVGTPTGTGVNVHAASAGADPILEEISLARSASMLGVSWVVRGPEPRILAALTAHDAHGFGEAIELGATQPADIAHLTRGRTLLFALEGGALVASHRLVDGPCSSPHVGASCAHLARTRLTSPLEPARRDDPMEVPEPCDALLAGATSTSGSWFYGVCHAQPQPVTTVYAIRPSISFAAATEILAGCAGEAMLALEDRALVIGRCGSTMQADVLEGTGSVTQHMAAFTSSVACAEGRPNITLSPSTPSPGDSAAGPSIEIPLRGPRSGLAATLPPGVAPAGARAVWTGSALLVASHVGADVTVHRFGCREGVFARTDP